MLDAVDHHSVLVHRLRPQGLGNPPRADLGLDHPPPGLWALLSFLLLIHLGNLFGPLPPDVTAIAWTGHAQWLLVAWAYWVDAHRSTLADYDFA
jgi:hypothetical protein